MTSDQFQGIARHVVSAVGGILLTLGTVNPDTVTQASGAVMALAALVWSLWEKTRRA